MCQESSGEAEDGVAAAAWPEAADGFATAVLAGQVQGRWAAAGLGQAGEYNGAAMDIEERSFAIVGAGVVGRSLAFALAEGGLRVAAVGSRRVEAARAVADGVRAPVATSDLAAAARHADVVVLSVPDDVVAAVCRAIAEGGGFEAGDIVVHLSGALGADELAAARGCGAHALAFHPAQTFARPDSALFRGIVCVLEGDCEAVGFGSRLAVRLGAVPAVVRPEAKALYHAALCIACNYFVALADAASGLLAEAGLSEAPLDVLMPLVRGTADNLERVGLPDALTGPISRGDVATVQKHLDALAVRAPALLPLYRSLGLRTVRLARRKGTVDAAQAHALAGLLAGPGGPGP